MQGLEAKKSRGASYIDTKYMHIKSEIDCHIRNKKYFSGIAALKMAISVRGLEFQPVGTLIKNLRTEMKLTFIPVINVANIFAK